MADVKWIKIMTDIFDNRKIKQIEKLPDADAIIIIWFKILCLAGNLNENGLITLTEDVPYTDEMLANEFNKPINTIRLALEVFQKFKMIEIINDIYCVSNWEKYQNVDGLEKIREQTRRRVAQHRERQKQLTLSESNVTCNVTVTQCNATDKDIDKEIEIDKDINKKNKKEKKSTEIDDLINSNFTDDELKNTVYEFIKMRKAIKKPLTTRGLELMIKKLYKITTNINEQIEILNNSIMNNWQGIYLLKQNDNNKNKGGFDDFKEIWEEAKLQDEQTGDHSNNNTFGW